MQRLLELPFQDRPRAVREIAEIANHLPSGVTDQFDRLVSASPAPERALQFFVRFRERQPEAFERLAASIAGIRHLVAIFTQSRFLSEEILEHPEWADQLLEMGSARTGLARPSEAGTNSPASAAPSSVVRASSL